VKRVVHRPGEPDAFLWPLARAGVAVASPHTAFDNCEGGINDLLAGRIGLSDVSPLRPAPAAGSVKVVVFTTDSDRRAVMDAAFVAGAGRIGAYRECSFGGEGTGTFFGGERASPAVGRAGRREEVAEWRLEFLCPRADARRAVEAIRRAHSYEEPAIDVYPLEPAADGRGGAGRLGRLPVPERLGNFAARLAELLDAPAVQYAGDPDRSVQRVAIACGAGDDFLGDAAGRADVLVTGEARYHRALEARSRGIGLVLAGHHATERPGVEALAAKIAAAFPALEAWASRAESDPLRPALGGEKKNPRPGRGKRKPR
jgi:putative NIF3 family GTP cyclohydrolase 1 type 2